MSIELENGIISSGGMHGWGEGCNPACAGGGGILGLAVMVTFSRHVRVGALPNALLGETCGVKYKYTNDRCIKSNGPD